MQAPPSAREHDFDDLAGLAAAVCDAPIASIALVDSDRVWLKARTGVEVDEIPRDLALSAEAMVTDDVFVVSDAANDERYRELAVSALGVRFFACAPLVAPSGARLGAVCVLDQRPRELTAAQADALRAIARQAITQLELRRLSQSEGAARRRFRMLVEQLRGVTYIEQFGTSSASYVSPQMEALVGWPPEEWARDPELFGKVLHPEDRDRVLSAFANAHAGFEPIQIEYRLVARDGSVVWVHDDSAVARDDDGNPLYLQGYMTNVTSRMESEEELRKAQERYRTLAERLPLVTYIDSIEVDGPMTYISPQIEDLVGYTAEEWLNDPGMFTRCLHPDDRDTVLERERQCKTEASTLDSEYRFVGRDGRVIWVHDTAVPVLDEYGATRYWQGFAIDVTERRAIESQRDRLLARARAQNERLREVDRMKDEFVALVSHELRTPLTSIRGYLDLVLDDTDRLDEEHRRFLEVVGRNADRLLRLVGDLLFVAQVEAGKLTLDRGEVDLASVVAGCVEAAEPLAAQAQVELRSDCETVPRLLGDPARLAQLVDNLLSNAIKFTPAAGRVLVRVSPSDGAAVLEVVDTGPGVPLDEQERLFERFFRAKRATENATPGTGLGLSIAKAITEAHGGSIGVTTEEGAGACFRVELPVGSVEPVAAA
ncbi:MAG TPA: PAS domain-containing protein [Gaiellaceae bacterium]